MKDFANAIAAAILGASILVAALIFRQPSAAPTPVAPIAADYAAAVKAAVAGDKTGLADEYLAGLFSGLKSKLPLLATRQQLHSLVAAIGKASADESGGVDATPLVVDVFGFLEKTGELTDADKSELSRRFDGVIAAAEAI